MRSFCLALFITLTLVSVSRGISTNAKRIFYLTWQTDPTTSITIHCIAPPDKGLAEIRYRPLGSDAWLTIPTEKQVLPGSDELNPESAWIIYHAHLKGLEPGTVYEARSLPGDPFRFKTLDPSASQLRFIVGGDVYKNLDAVEQTCKVAAKQDPAFVILGGDIVYATGDPALHTRCIDLMKVWHRTMVDSDGCIIPLMTTIGNHELRPGPKYDKSRATFYYPMFGYPSDRGYEHVRIGDLVEFLLLDSDHTNPKVGPQLDWMRNVLDSGNPAMHQIPVYHTPAYPGARRESTGYHMREDWTPLFDEFNIDIAFEHHDHVYKRTQPIRNERTDPSGTIYLGDGGWGLISSRDPAPAGDAGVMSNDRWYLVKSAGVNHFVMVDIDGKNVKCTAIEQSGQIIDSVEYVKGQPKTVATIPYTPVWLRREWHIGLSVVVFSIVWTIYTRRRRARLRAENVGSSS